MALPGVCSAPYEVPGVCVSVNNVGHRLLCSIRSERGVNVFGDMKWVNGGSGRPQKKRLGDTRTEKRDYTQQQLTWSRAAEQTF